MLVCGRGLYRHLESSASDTPYATRKAVNTVEKVVTATNRGRVAGSGRCSNGNVATEATNSETKSANVASRVQRALTPATSGAKRNRRDESKDER